MLKGLVRQLGVFALLVVLLSFLWPWPVILFLALLLVSAVMLYRQHSRRDLAFYSAAFVLGPLGEAIIVYFGNWSYSEPVFDLIPIWLPLIWGIAALLVQNLADLLAEESG